MYSIALKVPNGHKCQTFEKVITKYCCFKKSRIIVLDENNINDWIKRTTIATNKWTNIICYNDDQPLGKTFSTGGHCKGVVVWNDKEFGWLIHSVPKFPAVNNNKLDFNIQSKCDYGQSFVWITRNIKYLPQVFNQLTIMGSHIYHGNIPKIVTHTNISHVSLSDDMHCMSSCMKSVIPSISHVAKNHKWNKDLYEDFLAQTFKTKWITETWSRPGQAPTANVTRATHIKLHNQVFTPSQDHSKWAVSDPNSGIVIIGDINAMVSQFHRGGGGLIIKDPKLCMYFKSIIVASA